MTLTRELARANYPAVALGDVAEFLDHRRRPVKEADRTPGSYPYYGANGQQGTINGYIFDEPLILIAEDGGFFDNPSRGIAYRVSGKTWVNNHAHVLRPRPDQIDLAYLTRVLENYDVRPFISGTTRAKLTKGQAEKIEVPLPPLPEQRRIAAILDKADALRRKRKSAVDLLDSLMQSIFLEMFGDPAKNERDFPISAFEPLLATKPNFGSMIPPQKGVLEWVSLRVANIQDWALTLKDTKYIDLPKDSIDRHSLCDGDIILARAIASEEHLGKCVVVRPAGKKWAFDSHLMRIRLKSGLD